MSMGKTMVLVVKISEVPRSRMERGMEMLPELFTVALENTGTQMLASSANGSSLCDEGSALVNDLLEVGIVRGERERFSPLRAILP